MADFEVRDIQGQKVFIREFKPRFFLINNMFVYADPRYELDDEAITLCLEKLSDPYFPCKSAEEGCVLTLDYNEDNQEFYVGQWYLSEFTDATVELAAKEAYDEYKRWAGI